MTNTQTYSLFMDALDVVNRSLKANRGKGVYGRLLDAMSQFLNGHTSAVAVYEDDPGAPFDYYTIRYVDGLFELEEHGRGGHDSEWKVSRKYLLSLVDHPETYIEHPARMDLDWLADRLPESTKAHLL